MGDMMSKDLLLRPAKGRPDRRNLRHDIDAVAVLFNHAAQAPHWPSIRVSLLLMAVLVSACII